MVTLSRCGAVLVGLVVCFGASAAEPGPHGTNPPLRDGYRSVDEKGQVQYSEYPPPPGTASKKVNITPANISNPGPATHTRSDSRSASARRDPYPQSKQTPADRTDAAKQMELGERPAKATCGRYGGDDCPNTLTRNPERTEPLWRTTPAPERP